MTVRPWLISKDSDPDPAHPWYYTYRGPDCAAGGHYGSVETFARAVECATAEARDHARNCEGAR